MRNLRNLRKMRTMVPAVLLLGILLMSGCTDASEMAAAPESTPSPESVTTPEPTATSEPITAPEQTVMPEQTSNDEIIPGFRNWVIEKVLENYWDGDIISASDIVIDQIYYGSFSQEDVCEMLVECKILNLPHVAGLDRRVCLLMPCDSLELTAYTEFPGDRVELDIVQVNSGQSRVVVIKTGISQGIAAQYIGFWAVQDQQWVPVETELGALPIVDTWEGEYTLDSSCFCFLSDNIIFVASGYQSQELPEITAVLIWDPDMEKYVAATTWWDLSDKVFK